MYLHLMVAQILWYFNEMAFQYDSETVQQVSLVTGPQDEMTMKLSILNHKRSPMYTKQLVSQSPAGLLIL